MTHTTCDHCGADNPSTARYCRRCGRPTGEPLLRSVTPTASALALWRQLSTKMTRKDVRRLLGEPARLQAADASHADATETWTYEYEVVGRPAERVTGAVRFVSGEGSVLTWTEPEWERLKPPAE
jgi:formate-dependent phosphoribosylglycinamide formyltransferase (GAR transformylase)